MSVAVRSRTQPRALDSAPSHLAGRQPPPTFAPAAGFVMIPLTVPAPTSVLAAAGDASGAFGRLLPWLGLLVLLIIGGGFVIAMIRRAATGEEGSAGRHGFTLQDLREMRQRGELSDTEFEAARDRMLGRRPTTDPQTATDAPVPAADGHGKPPADGVSDPEGKRATGGGDGDESEGRGSQPPSPGDG